MPESSPNVRSIFDRALEIESEAGRRTFLDEACPSPEIRAQVEALLAAHAAAGSFMEAPPAAVRVDPGPTIDQPTERIGTQIGPYKLIEQIGEGGMGTVWMAQQSEPVKRLVALKVIKPGMDSRQVIARFEAERQALALMDHPNISRVLDGGTTDAGRPYFVMDLVRGVPITRYCDEHHLTPRQRLELFIPVCQAIQHAHQKGIIHRDLKPSNVLVALYDGRPVPKVIDFGVAKATGQPLTEQTLVTGFGAIVGTLEYMSPEQAEINQLDIDTRSDIYSLGVLLYELLTGSPPFTRKELEQAGMLEMLRVIREQEPSKPSTKLSTAEGLPTLAANRGTEPAKLTRLVRGELDWIVMKALEKDRNRRYETANGLAQDIQRYLQDQPVLACPPSAAYRLRKLARRNKAALMTAALVFAALVLGTVISTWQAIRAIQAGQAKEAARLKAEANEKKALQEAAKSQQVAEFLKDIFSAPGAGIARGRDFTLLHEMIDRAASRIETGLKEQPEVEAELRMVMGWAYVEVTEYRKAAVMYRRALELYRKLHGNEHPLVADALMGIAMANENVNKPDAESCAREALAIRRKLFGAEHPAVAEALRRVGTVLFAQGKRAEAESALRESLSMRRKVSPDDHVAIGDSLWRLGRTLPQDQNREAEAILREAVETYRKHAPDDARLSMSLINLAIILQHEGRLTEAEAAARESVERIRVLGGDNSKYLLEPLYRFMVILHKQGKEAEIEELLDRVPIPTLGRAPYRAGLLQARAQILERRGKLVEAQNLRAEAEALLQGQRQRTDDQPTGARTTTAPNC